jgi:hypothetical protein
MPPTPAPETMDETQGAEPEPRSSAAIGGVRSLLERARSVARRSHRISWLSFGFLFAVYGGFFVLALLGVADPVVTTTMTAGGGTATSTTWPTWGYALAMPPAIVVLALMVREFLRGRSELEGAPPAAAPPTDGADEGWTRQAVEAQKLLADAKHETDSSLFPLAFAFLGLGEMAGLEGAFLLLPSLSGLAFFIGLGLGFAGLLLLIPFWRLARTWIGGNQTLLDRQVREVSELETAFLARFADPSP